MNIKIDRPLCLIDLETTGTNTAKDRIVEFGVVKVFPDGSRKEWVQRCNPDIPIPPEVSELIGITDDDVRECPPFVEVAQRIHAGLVGCDLAGFNLSNFDIPLLHEEFSRAGIRWDLTGVRVIDAGTIMKKHEERTLSATLKFYCGRTHEDAHGALPDALATLDVLEAQVVRYQDIGTTVEDLAAASKHDGPQRIDLAGKFLRDADGDAVYNIGKNRGRKVKEDPSFIYWMLTKDFTADTLHWAGVILSDLERQRESKCDCVAAGVDSVDASRCFEHGERRS